MVRVIHKGNPKLLTDCVCSEAAHVPLAHSAHYRPFGRTIVLRIRPSSILAGVSSLLCLTEASAHHAMSGATPETFTQGLLSGLAHPIIGIDHLAFVVLVGIAASFATLRLIIPLAFVVATVVGCMLRVAAVSLPAPELVITASVVAVGAMVVSGRTFPAVAYLVIFTVAGLFHGWAYGESIVGAEATPLVAYLTGFTVIQYTISLAIAWLVRSLWNAAEPSTLRPRLAGAVAAGVGLAFLIENIEAMLFS